MTRIIRNATMWMGEHTDMFIYIVELSTRKGHSESWSRMPVAPTSADYWIAVSDVPPRIRRAARAHFKAIYETAS